MHYALEQIRQFEQSLPLAMAKPALKVNNGYVSLHKISEHEYLAIWADTPGQPKRAGVLDTQDYADLCTRLIGHPPDDYGYGLAIVDYAKYAFDAQGQAYLPDPSSNYDYAD